MTPWSTIIADTDEWIAAKGFVTVEFSASLETVKKLKSDLDASNIRLRDTHFPYSPARWVAKECETCRGYNVATPFHVSIESYKSIPYDPSHAYDYPPQEGGAEWRQGYVTETAIAFKDGRMIPKGSGVLIDWAEYPSRGSVVIYDEKEYRMSGWGIGQMLCADEPPSRNQVEEWVYDSVCPTPTGHEVEPDGYGPDGCPSWLLLMGLI